MARELVLRRERKRKRNMEGATIEQILASSFLGDTEWQTLPLRSKDSCDEHRSRRRTMHFNSDTFFHERFLRKKFLTPRERMSISACKRKNP